jgi:hypothetical protein
MMATFSSIEQTTALISMFAHNVERLRERCAARPHTAGRIRRQCRTECRHLSSVQVVQAMGVKGGQQYCCSHVRRRIALRDSLAHC